MRGGARPSGTDFELRVAEDLKRAGWEARRTMKSAQAGRHDLVDVHAETFGVQLAVECKFSKDRRGKQSIRVDLSDIKEAAAKAVGSQNEQGVPVLAVNSKVGPLYIFNRSGIKKLAEQIFSSYEDGMIDGRENM